MPWMHARKALCLGPCRLHRDMLIRRGVALWVPDHPERRVRFVHFYLRLKFQDVHTGVAHEVSAQPLSRGVAVTPLRLAATLRAFGIHLVPKWVKAGAVPSRTGIQVGGWARFTPSALPLSDSSVCHKACASASPRLARTSRLIARTGCRRCRAARRLLSVPWTSA